MDRLWHERHMAEENVKHKDAGDDDQRQPQRPVDGDSQGHHTDRGNGDVSGGRQASTTGDALLKPEQIQTTHRGDGCQNPVVDRHSVAWTGLEKRVGQHRQTQRKG